MNGLESRVRESVRRMGEEVRPSQLLPPQVRKRTRRRQALTSTVAAMVLAGVFVGGAVGLSVIRSTAGHHVGPAPASTPWAGVGTGWTELPPPPQVRDGASYVWVGDRLLAWGGLAPGSQSTPTSDGFAFDPATMSWTSIPSAPVPGEYARAVWTGTEAIFIGVGTDPSRLQAEAFDPSSGTWRVMPQSPLAPRSREMVAWTGQELIVWGGGKSGDPANASGAAYVPSTNAWHAIADAPIGLNQGDAVWTGHEMLVFGSLLNNGNVASTQNAGGAEYDPSTDTWYAIPPSSLSPQATSAVWLGGNGLLAWDYEAHAQVGDMHAQAHDGASNTWGEVQTMPFEPGECYPDSALVPNVSGDTVFAWYCGQAAIWDSVSGTWKQVHGGPTEPTVQANGGSYKLFRFADLVPAGNVLVLAAEGITVGKGEEPCYGCPGAPHSYWVYRPPSDAPTPAEIAPPAFAPADGWHTISTSTNPKVVDPEAAPTVWAANVPFDPSDLAGRTANGALTDAYFPSNTMKSLSGQGVVIVASLAGRGAGASPNVNFPARSLPLRLSDAQVLDSWEGQVAPNVPEYRLLETVDGQWLDVRVYFGTLAPSASTLQAAQEQLSRLQLPSRAG